MMPCLAEGFDLQKARACARELTKTLRQRKVDGLWNRASLSVGAAWGLHMAGARVADARSFGGAAWVVGTLPFCISEQARAWLCRHGQWALQAQYDTRDDDVVPGEEDAFTFGGRIYLGSGSVNGFAELLGTSLTDAPEGSDGFTAETSAGLEFRATDDAWLTTGLGTRFADRVQADRIFVIAGLHWNVASGPAFRR